MLLMLFILGLVRIRGHVYVSNQQFVIIIKAQVTQYGLASLSSIVFSWSNLVIVMAFFVGHLGSPIWGVESMVTPRNAQWKIHVRRHQTPSIWANYECNDICRRTGKRSTFSKIRLTLEKSWLRACIYQIWPNWTISITNTSVSPVTGSFNWQTPTLFRRLAFNEEWIKGELTITNGRLWVH